MALAMAIQSRIDTLLLALSIMDLAMCDIASAYGFWALSTNPPL
jgi:hypothetical protein